MKEALLPRLRCPACQRSLRVQVWSHAESEIAEGLLSCDCGNTFPIILGVPRMLLGAFRAQLHADYGDFFEHYRARLPESLVAAGTAPFTDEGNTQRSFGFEWTKFAAMRPEWERNYWEYQAPFRSEFFAGKFVLDAGCGMGRHLFHTGQHAQEAIGVDFSRAVDSAFRNTRHLPNTHVVQADLCNLPFADSIFDYAYSIGVLHHLPDPTLGLKAVLPYVRPGGILRVYLYWDLSDGPRWKRVLLAGVTAARTVTRRLPHSLLHALCFPISVAAWATFVQPYRILSRLPATRAFAETLPLKQYAGYPFGVLVNDQFDRFSAPLEKRYSATEVRDWLEAAGLMDVHVRPNWGWLGYGRVLVPVTTVTADNTHRVSQPVNR
jgi:SAM-dependent methyltransferase